MWRCVVWRQMWFGNGLGLPRTMQSCTPGHGYCELGWSNKGLGVAWKHFSYIAPGTNFDRKFAPALLPRIMRRDNKGQKVYKHHCIQHKVLFPT